MEIVTANNQSNIYPTRASNLRMHKRLIHHCSLIVLIALRINEAFRIMGISVNCEMHVAATAQRWFDPSSNLHAIWCTANANPLTKLRCNNSIATHGLESYSFLNYRYGDVKLARGGEACTPQVT